VHLLEAVYRNADPVFEGLEIVDYGVKVEIPESEEGLLQAAKTCRADWPASGRWETEADDARA